MIITEIIIIILIICISLELIFRSLVFLTRKEFQWFITKNDEFPELPQKDLKKFFVHGFDSELGWVRKPKTNHDESGKYGTTQWSINEKGSRINPGFENKKSNISCYGDSFTFSRQVNNDETWEHQFSKIIEENVQNFGVGNYGIDQALLRLKREFFKNKTKTVIIGVVPDTITRILSIWKHYSEYGNTFGFKPRFILKDNSISLIKNIIDEEEKFFDYKIYLSEIKKNDYFYEKKFKNDIIKFPYTISLFKNFKRNFGIIYWVIKIKKAKKTGKNYENVSWEAMKYVMKQNLELRIKLFQNNQVKKLLRKIIEEYIQFSKEENFNAVFIFLPQKDDLIYIKNNYHFYKEFQNELKLMENLIVIDITEDLLKKYNLDELYSDNNSYGGHYSKEGNKEIAKILSKKMKELNLINI
jgi:hypothetical protein